MVKPARFASIGAFLPLALSAISLPLAYGAAPRIPFSENPIILFILFVLVISCVMVVIPRVCNWNWEAKYFGASVFHASSIALTGLVPCFCVVVYGKPHIAVRLTVLLIYLALHVVWCRRFAVFYNKLNSDIKLRRCLYQEEEDAVYYMQRGDKYLLEKQYKFIQLPQDRYFVLFLLFPILLMPVMDTVNATVGLPFVHTFLLIGMLPVSLMGVGFAMRGWLVFYFYPMQIRKATGKRVYVDMSGKPDLCRQRKRANLA